MLPNTGKGVARARFGAFKWLLLFAAIQGGLAIMFAIRDNVAGAAYMAVLCVISLSAYTVSARTSRR